MKQDVLRRVVVGQSGRGLPQNRTVFRLSTPQISVDVYGTEAIGGTLALVSEAAGFEADLVGERIADDWTAFRVEASVPFADDFQIVYGPADGEPVVLSGAPRSTGDLLTLAETQGGCRPRSSSPSTSSGPDTPASPPPTRGRRRRARTRGRSGGAG